MTDKLELGSVTITGDRIAKVRAGHRVVSFDRASVLWIRLERVSVVGRTEDVLYRWYFALAVAGVAVYFLYNATRADWLFALGGCALAMVALGLIAHTFKKVVVLVVRGTAGNEALVALECDLAAQELSALQLQLGQQYGWPVNDQLVVPWWRPAPSHPVTHREWF